jgi:hypothetical protein
MNKIKIIIPTSKSPNTKQGTIKQVQCILKELEKKREIEVFWIIISNSNNNTKQENYIYFKKFKNAFQIIDQIKPDIIFIDGSLDYLNTSFWFAGKIRKIPIVTSFISYPANSLKVYTNYKIMNKRLRIIFSKNNKSHIIDFKHNPKKSLFPKMRFFFETLNNYKNLISALIIFIDLSYNYFTKYFPTKYNEGNLNLCATNDIEKELISRGFNSKSLKIVGDPIFDDLFFQKHLVAQKKKSKKRILFCTSPMHETGLWKKNDEIDLILKVLRKINSSKDYEIVIKIHPTYSKISEYQDFLKNEFSSILIFKDENVTDLLNEYDMMITYGESSITLHGILCKKPVLIVNFKQKYLAGASLYYNSNVCSLCTNENSLIEFIEKTMKIKITDEIFSKYTTDVIGQFDGKSSLRSANEILLMVNLN